MTEALKRIFGSMKIWTAIIGIGCIEAARHGIQIPNDEVTMMYVILGVVLGGQALAGHGKEAAAIAAANPPPGPVTQVAQGDAVNVQPPATAVTP